MKFETSEQLANHVKKFCVNSDYADKNKIEDKLKSLNKGRNTQSMSNFNFHDVKSGLKRGQFGGMSLENLKGHFESNRMRFNDIQKQALRSKEKEKIDELQQLKRDREMLYHKKANVSHMLASLKSNYCLIINLLAIF